ncbi:MAG: pantoate--beta-alanine ligase [Kiritimatiellae bacterium]|nr:pantoate--beta-alanine ligase [Kiritimatiellia bacterium]
MKTFREPKKLQKWCRERKLEGRKIALVPTMGYLHEGHVSLIEKARRMGADEIVVSVFVNPVQFGPNEDYAKYPRDARADYAKCRAAGATAVFFPTPENMYLDRHSVYVNEEDLSKGLCGARRPGHFRGVCTVVAKLFNLAHPDFAVFGQKDYQQAQVIKRMVRDLNFDLKIVVAPIVREPSGLARSSRNTYLSADGRERALAISRSLKGIRIGRTARAESARIRRELEAAGLVVDYVEFVDGETLEPAKTARKGVTALVAAYCGRTRLIDNRVL